MNSGQNEKWLKLILVKTNIGDKWWKWKVVKIKSSQNLKWSKLSGQVDEWWKLVEIKVVKRKFSQN